METVVAKGVQPRIGVAATPKYLQDRLAEVRKSSESLAGFGLANIIGNVIRKAPDNVWMRRGPLALGLAQLVLALIAASPRRTTVNSAKEEGYLRRTLRWRLVVRNSAAVLLLGGMLVLVWETW